MMVLMVNLRRKIGEVAEEMVVAKNGRQNSVHRFVVCFGQGYEGMKLVLESFLSFVDTRFDEG